MKKQRVFALMLAFTLSVNMNGMTVFATVSDADVFVPTVVGGNVDAGETDSIDGQALEASESEGGTGNQDSGNMNGSNGENSGVEDAVKEDSDSQENSGDHTQDKEGNFDENSGLLSEGEDVTDQDKTEEIGLVEDAQKQDETEADNSVSENVIDKEDKFPEAAEQTVTMTIFTDETGMRITYNAAMDYNFKVTDGVLEDITNADGTAVSGVVVVPEGKGITAVGAAFQENKNITYVKLPSGVMFVQEGAFSGCSGLEGIYLPKSVHTIGNRAFENCSSLLKIAIPKQVTSIGDNAFYQNSSLFMIFMQDADYSELRSIGDQAFYQCGKLQFFGSDSEFIIPGELESIGAKAFYECSSIGRLDFHESVKSIGESAFEGCTSLEAVVLSSKLETISARAFAGCRRMLSLKFKKGNKIIGAAAFEGCSRLGHVELILDITDIGDHAFSNCGGLVSVRIRNGHAVIGTDAFPNDHKNPPLVLIADNESTAQEYAKGKANIIFVDADTASSDKSYYKYTVAILGVRGGKLEIRDAKGKDPNKLNAEKGVAYGTELFITPVLEEGIVLRSGSVKCNGIALEDVGNGVYKCIMPIGGAYITAEFANKSDTNVQGTDKDIKIKVSNGEAETNEDGNVQFLLLKVGQASRIFLTDERDENRTIANSKVKFATDSPAIVSVKADGTIRALKSGTAGITVKVKDVNDNEVTRSFAVNVIEAKAAQLKIKAVEWDASCVKLEETVSGLQSMLVDSNDLKEQPTTFKLRVTAYDKEEDKVAVPLKWSSSDSKVVRLGAFSTAANSTDNVITIPKGASGEATIRVTAAIDKNTTVTQKFVIKVADSTPRLAQKSITLNPNHAEGARLQIINAYGYAVDTDNVTINGDSFNYLKVDFLPTESDSTISTFQLTARPGLRDGTYPLKVNVGNSKQLPLTVKVKTSEPNPKIAFEKKQPKINFFYANDGTEIKVNVSNLGKEKVSRYELQPLLDKPDDRLFTENFEVEYVDKDTCLIRQKADTLLCASEGKGKGKPVLTGKLRMRFEGYSDQFYIDRKITIPAQRTALTFKLNRTSDTFRTGCGEQEINLQLVDKKNKPVDLSAGGYVLSFNPGDSWYTPVNMDSDTIDIDDAGRFTLTLADYAESGEVKLRLTNDLLWAKDEKFDFVYKVSVVNTVPKISLTDGAESAAALKSSTITLNPNYPDQTVEFGLKSNQKGTVIADEQEFKPNATAKNQAQYDCLDVQYTNGVGSVTIKEDYGKIKDGTYTYVCKNVQYIDPRFEEPQSANPVTLKVKVKKGNPTVTVKGSLVLNQLAKTYDGSFAEKSELTLVTKNLPDGYTFDLEKSELKCITKNRSDYINYFDWELIDRQIGVDGKITEGKLTAVMNTACKTGTYKFSIKPAYSNGSHTLLAAKAVNFNLKVHEGKITVKLAANGKVNLLDRTSQCSAANSIVYTPSLKNVKDKVIAVKVFDYKEKLPGYDSVESELFEAQVLSDGKIYVRPKEGAELENNKTYKIWIWTELEKHKFPDPSGRNGGGMFQNNPVSIKTAQTLPKVRTDRSSVDLYLSNKNYVATFIVDKKDVKAVGSIESIAFGEKDTKAQESFVTTEDMMTGKNTVIESEQLEDGSLQVKLKLRDAVFYGCDTANKLTMYVRFEGQGTNTPGTAITMNVKINK